jgi:hypothetical protein
VAEGEHELARQREQRQRSYLEPVRPEPTHLQTGLIPSVGKHSKCASTLKPLAARVKSSSVVRWQRHPPAKKSGLGQAVSEPRRYARPTILVTIGRITELARSSKRHGNRPPLLPLSDDRGRFSRQCKRPPPGQSRRRAIPNESTAPDRDRLGRASLCQRSERRSPGKSCRDLRQKKSFPSSETPMPKRDQLRDRNRRFHVCARNRCHGCGRGQHRGLPTMRTAHRNGGGARRSRSGRWVRRGEGRGR